MLLQNKEGLTRAWIVYNATCRFETQTNMDPEILESCEIRNYKKDDVILRQQDEADGMYVIKSGKVQVEMNGEKIATLEQGEFFGEMGMLLREPRNATITVISEDLSAYFLTRETYDRIKKEVGQEVMAKLFERTAQNCER